MSRSTDLYPRAPLQPGGGRLSFRPILFPEEVACAARHRRDSFVVSFGHADMFDESKYVRYLTRLSERLPGGIAFALLESEIVGQIEAQVRPDGTGYVNLFYLVPKWRGRGLGNQLNDYVVSLLHEQGVTQIELAVSPTNTPALRYYERHGYRRLGLRTNAEPPVLEMRLDLTPSGSGQTALARSQAGREECVKAPAKIEFEPFE